MERNQFELIEHGDVLRDRGGNLFVAAIVNQYKGEDGKPQAHYVGVMPCIDAEIAQHWTLEPGLSLEPEPARVYREPIGADKDPAADPPPPPAVEQN